MAQRQVAVLSTRSMKDQRAVEMLYVDCKLFR